MKAQPSNQVLSSFLLFLDHEILKKGDAFTNANSYFYPTQSLYNGYYTYSSPYSQFVSDFSITGATIPTGVYLDNTFIGTGQSGLAHIDYNKGSLYFTGQITGNNRISGSFAVKDFNIQISKDADETILFESKHYLRPRISQTTTGLFPNEMVYPVIYIKNDGGQNEPFAFGGLRNTKFGIRVLILADSPFILDAVQSVIRDIKDKYVPLITGSAQPFDFYGDYKGTKYNYETLTSGSSPNLYIESAFVGDFDRYVRSDGKSLPPNTFYGICDIDLCWIRQL